MVATRKRHKYFICEQIIHLHANINRWSYPEGSLRYRGGTVGVSVTPRASAGVLYS